MNEQLEQMLEHYQQGSNEVICVDEPRQTLVLFQISDQRFALYGAQVKEILADRPVSWVPGCAPTLEGVISNRGRVESVIRLSQLLEISSHEPAVKRSILIGRSETMQSGILVDKLIDVLEVVESQILPVPDSLPPVMQKIVVGIVNISDVYYTLLDLNLVFTRYLESCGYDSAR